LDQFPHTCTGPFISLFALPFSPRPANKFFWFAAPFRARVVKTTFVGIYDLQLLHRLSLSLLSLFFGRRTERFLRRRQGFQFALALPLLLPLLNGLAKWLEACGRCPLFPISLRLSLSAVILFLGSFFLIPKGLSL